MNQDQKNRNFKVVFDYVSGETKGLEYENLIAITFVAKDFKEAEELATKLVGTNPSIGYILEVDVYGQAVA